MIGQIVIEQVKDATKLAQELEQKQAKLLQLANTQQDLCIKFSSQITRTSL
mgnify:CR=1 FL=1